MRVSLLKKGLRQCFGFCATLAVVCANSSAQNADLLPPPKPNLVAVHWPDLAQLESDVRDQIIAQQNSLASTLKDRTASDAKLSAAYGAMGEIYHAYSLAAPARECYLNANTLAPN